MVTTRRQGREEREKRRREKVWNSISNNLTKRRRTLLNSIAADGITSEILLRLPVDSLSRFKCASMSWYTLLHEPFFINDISSSSSSVKFNKAVVIERPFISSKPVFSIHGSCNGIFLITTFHRFERICLWNPSTREYKDIAEQFSNTPKYPRELYPFICIGYWLGYDLSMDDYKVIRIAYHHNIDTVSDAYVYSMRTNSCKRIQDIPYRIYGVVSGVNFSHDGILLHRAIHWLGNRGLMTDRFPLRIVTFDFTNETFNDLQLPDDVLYSRSIRLGVLEDCLWIYSLNKDNHIDMFVMKEYGVKESWTKMFSITDQSIAAMGKFKVISITNEGKLLVQWNYKDIALYDPNHGGRRCGNIKIQGIPRRISNFFRVETYVKSFVSLGTNTYVI
ncbi:hypothetical protein AQUCO_01600266v1 [Aquilegia coerulea]|uniref:F-box associated beta-propeller type 1 domain-containing protein n=1 Tax=Aquilegia coerulea TaxID=218851 RepID=A0A2G5DR41_AQUCA|nr:hypothetical protein AQUCO_01600266v1 [Aquilegia coerulea]